MDKMDIDSILKDLEQTISGASRIPLTNKVLVDGEVVLEAIDKIYVAMPEEIKQARQVLDQSDKLLESMESQGKRIIEEARAYAAKLVEQSEIIKEATAQAAEIRAQAERNAADLRAEAVTYAEDLLKQLEMNLDKAMFSIHKTKDDLQNYHK